MKRRRGGGGRGGTDRGPARGGGEAGDRSSGKEGCAPRETKGSPYLGRQAEEEEETVKHRRAHSFSMCVVMRCVRSRGM